MKYFGRTVTFLLLSLMLPLLSMSQSLHIENPIRYLALGDSYTIGESVPVSDRWPEQLSDSLASRGIQTNTLRIIATTGWRTDNLINAIRNQNLEDQNYNLVSLLIGVNNQYQNRPFSQYVAEFPALADSAIRYAGGDPSRVFIVSIPDYAYTPFGQQSSNPGQISSQIDQYNNYARQIADDLNITFFDITPISRLGLQYPAYVANDGLHPSGVQYTEWVKLMLNFIDQQITRTKTVINDNFTINISPNPTSDMIRIDLPESSVEESFNLKIYNLTGVLIEEQVFRGNSCDISLNNQPDGLFLLKIASADKQVVRKVIKK